MRDTPLRLLLLGGTAEARALADAIAARFGAEVELTYSLAGRTRAPRLPAGTLHSGGFGGAAGLARFLSQRRIDLLLDATHPFATRIKQSARDAAMAARVPLFALGRPVWVPDPADDWRLVADAAAAAALLPALGRRVFLTLGTQLDAFAALGEHWFLVRLIEPRAVAVAQHEIVLGRGPFSLDAERALFDRHRIEILVTKQSGGAATAPKLAVARERRVPVVMIARPQAVEGGAPADALGWIAACRERRLDERAARREA